MTVHKHLDTELTKLTQMKIPPKEALILLLEKIIIMFNRFYAIYHKHMDFIVKGTQVEYMVWCICLTLQVHMAMDDFVKDRMNYDLAISAAFICFLTKQMGKNVSMGTGPQFQKITNKIVALEGALKEVKRATTGAGTCATSASTGVDVVKGQLTKLFQANPTRKR